MTRVVVHIDRLVLRGVAASARDELAAALTAELGRLLAAPDARYALDADRHIARLQAGALRIVAPSPAAPGAPATAGAPAPGLGGVIGAAVARAVAGGLG